MEAFFSFGESREYICEFLPFLMDPPVIEDSIYDDQEKRSIMRDNLLWDSPISKFDNSFWHISWVLARLWHLTKGEITKSLNLNTDEENKKNSIRSEDGSVYFGSQDGGVYYCQGVIKTIINNEIIATFYLEGIPLDNSNGFRDLTQFYLTECSERFDFGKIKIGLSNRLWEEPDELAICHLSMYCFEEKKYYHYGWDGINLIR